MSEFRFDLLEDLSGTGEIAHRDGATIGPAEYYLQVYRKIHETTSGDVPGLKEIHGSVDGIDTFRLTGKPLTLTLEDGRRFKFFITHSDGTIAAQGDLE